MTLGDLGGYCAPTIRLMDELVDGLTFGSRIIMIELQNNGIGDAAVGARMREQVFPDLLLEYQRVGARSPVVPHYIRGLI